MADLSRRGVKGEGLECDGIVGLEGRVPQADETIARARDQETRVGRVGQADHP